MPLLRIDPKTQYVSLPNQYIEDALRALEHLTTKRSNRNRSQYYGDGCACEL